MTDTEISAGSEARPSGWARAKAALIPPTAAHWGWWAAGIGMGLTIATVAVTLAGRNVTSPAPAGGKAMEQAVKDAILANPEVIPEAINRLQQREVEKLLASNREAIETPFAGAWTGAKDADVVLVEFFDYNCPYCRQSVADVERLLAEDPKLKVVYRDMPVLGPDSERFARASLSAAEQGRYRLVELSTRPAGRPLPGVRIVDMRRHFRKGTLLSPALAEGIRDRVGAGEQVVLVLNRRGFANFLQCQDCGHVFHI